MSTIIRCPNCCKCLGAYMDAYDYLFSLIKRDYIKANLNEVATTNILQSLDWGPEAGALLDALGLENRCCRMNMLSKIKISDT